MLLRIGGFEGTKIWIISHACLKLAVAPIIALDLEPIPRVAGDGRMIVLMVVGSGCDVETSY